MKWLAEHPRMTVLWLPRYAPELNPVDEIWWYLKQKVAANRCYLTIEHLKEAAEEFFCQMDEAQPLRLASLLPEKLLRSYLEIGVWTKRHSSGAD